MKKPILVKALFCLLTITLLGSFDVTNVNADHKVIEGGNCKWATREVSAGWEAVCISTGVGYSCSCGTVKKYY